MGFDPTTSKFVEALQIVYYLSDKSIDERVNIYKSLGFSVGDVWEIFKKYPMLLSLSEQKILNRIETFRGLGFSRVEVGMMFKGFPPCIWYSEKSVKIKTGFLVKKMNWPIKALAFQPQVFKYGNNIEKIVPRCNVIKALISKGLFGSELPAISSVLVDDQTFLKRYVLKHYDKELVAELMSIFKADYTTRTMSKR